MTTPNERPILFSAEMVRAILDGRKTQTRRIVKRQPDCEVLGRSGSGLAFPDGTTVICPYGVPCDRLWVRETWAAHFIYDDVPPRECRSGLPDDSYWYAGDPEGTPGTHGCPSRGCRGKWRPSIHMPRWVSRITLEVTDVRVERVQEITCEDVYAEGINVSLDGPDGAPCYIEDFSLLWDSINGAGAWGRNDWVWVISFKRVMP